MAENYSVKINRRDGALEVAGDKEWVDQKLRELAPVFEAPIDPQAANIPTTSTRKRRTSRAKQADNGEAKPRRRRSGRPQKNPDLAAKLTGPIKQKLQEYRDARSTAFEAKAPNAAAIIAGFLRDEVEVNEMSEDDLYTVYSVMGWSTPNITKAMENAYGRDRYFGGSTDGKRELTQAGENFARHRSVNEA